MRVGESWNESEVLQDQATGRFTRRLTRTGLYNETPTYHLHACFSADGKYLVFGSAREGRSALIRATVDTGELTVMATADGIGNMHGMPASAMLGPYAEGSLGGGFTGNHMAMAGEWVAAQVGRSLRAYHLRSFEERVLIADVGPAHRLGNPIGSIDGKSVIVPRSVAHPDVARGDLRTNRTYFEACAAEFGGMPTTYLQIDLATGEIREVFSEKVCGSNHVQPCPADGGLWLIDRDMPPKFSHGGDAGQTSRAWLLDTRTKALTEIRPRHANRFQIHTNWNARGDRVYYHGWSFRPEGEHYIGVADTRGQILWEGHYPRFFYGHVSVHTKQEAIITDGLITPDLVTAIYYEQLQGGWPRVEILARHGTQLDALRGQYSHPHVHMSPNGRWISYNKGELGRTDVYLVRVAE